MKFAFLLTLLFFMTSCASYINKIHKDLDRADGRQYTPPAGRHSSTFNQFKKSGAPNTQSQSNLMPAVKRNYQPAEAAQKRYTANDLTDNSDQGSLWAGSGNDNYLFTKNKWKRNGDIILVNIQSKLKNDITMELKRSVPAPPPARPKVDPKAPPGTEPAPAAPAPVAAEEKDVPDDDKVHDKLSAVIVEEISKDHLLLRGQKFLLFRNQKHLVELQALIARKDIMDDDTVNSSNFLESSLVVLR